MVKAAVHIIISLSVFLSTTGVWINDHYCQNQYDSSQFTLNSNTCCAKTTTNSCTSNESNCHDNDEDNGCCNTTPRIFKIDQDQIINQVEFTVKKHLKVLAPKIVGLNFQLFDPKSEIHKQPKYDIPFIVYNRQVRLQTFRC